MVVAAIVAIWRKQRLKQDNPCGGCPVKNCTLRNLKEGCDNRLEKS